MVSVFLHLPVAQVLVLMAFAKGMPTAARNAMKKNGDPANAESPTMQFPVC